MANTRFTLGFSRKTLIAALLGGIAALALALPLAATAQEAAPAVSATEAEMMTIAPELFGFLKANFPEDFSGFVTQVETTVASGGNVEGMVATHMLELRQKYAVHLTSASDEALTSVMTASIALQQAVMDGEGAAACGGFVVSGPGVFEGTPAAAKYEDLVMAQIVLLLAAAKGGHDAPVTREPASEADWKLIAEKTVEAGASQTGLQAIAMLDAANPELCTTLLTMLEAMNTESSGVGARVRADYLAQVGTL
ncbi:hypothetical protein SAMN05428969_3438 [Devosia sp. YR412]|uniref:hypothetical protein n=1 Tax=Devosia sp. YR412 TaxID=1881030 RepID=UPI0008C46C9C|nr:hypothetical protein [Devosia sp. YR412]SEQ53934.1 hypothetical protein SAMN05428969_3438 [Devosia sp. YR412]